MDAWWWILHVVFASIGSVMFWAGAFFGNNLYEGMFYYNERSESKLDIIVAVLFWGGAGTFVWSCGLPLWEGIVNNKGHLATSKGVATFVALYIITLIVCMGIGGGLLFLPDFLAQRKCRRNGGHHFKRIPLIEGVCYEEICECGKRGQAGPYVREGDPDWGW